MPSIFALPDWVPSWVQLVLLILGSLFALAFLAMPFAVFGTKARLEAIEAQLDELRAELRALAVRRGAVAEEPVETYRAGWVRDEERGRREEAVPARREPRLK